MSSAPHPFRRLHADAVRRLPVRYQRNLAMVALSATALLVVLVAG